MKLNKIIIVLLLSISTFFNIISANKNNVKNKSYKEIINDLNNSINETVKVNEIVIDIKNIAKELCEELSLPYNDIFIDYSYNNLKIRFTTCLSTRLIFDPNGSSFNLDINKYNKENLYKILRKILTENAYIQERYHLEDIDVSAMFVSAACSYTSIILFGKFVINSLLKQQIKVNRDLKTSGLFLAASISLAYIWTKKIAAKPKNNF